MELSSSRFERPLRLVLEAVPPEVHLGRAGMEAVVEKVATVHAAVGLDAVNIPEIREERSKSEKGERRKPFAPRVEPRELAYELRERVGVECMINRVVVHLERGRQLDWFRESWERFGVREFVLVGGERSDVTYPGPSVPEANTLLREQLAVPGLRLGNICIPTRAGEAARLGRKLASGADFFTTQIVYHGDEFTTLLDALRDAAPPPELLLTLCPVRSARNIRFLHWLGVSVSDELEAWLTAGPESVGERSLAHIRQTWREIVDYHRSANHPCPLGVSLAPIGRVPNATTVALAEGLVADAGG